MTALTTYARLESGGLWRTAPEAQRRDVVVSFGDATLVLCDATGQPLTHWSLPAIDRLNPGALPALYSPDPSGAETLEIDDDTMIDALETIRRATRRGGRRPGLLRWGLTLGLLAGAVALALFWLPGAARHQAQTAATATTRSQIDRALLQELQLLTGPACSTREGSAALRRLQQRLGTGAPIVILPGELPEALALPGGTLVLDRAMVELPDDPDVTAGHVLAAQAAAQGNDPLGPVLHSAGFGATMRLLTSGALPPETLRGAAQDLAREAPPRASDTALIACFTEAEVPLRPWAFDIDITGETVLPLIEASPATTRPTLSDGDWLSLQAICSL